MNDWNQIPQKIGEPDFENLLAVLRREVPSRPTLFEFFLNHRLYQRLAPLSETEAETPYATQRQVLHAYYRAGYDFTNVLIPEFSFPSERTEGTRTISINDGGLIHNPESFERYVWPDPEAADYTILDVLNAELPTGMKLIGYGPNGVLENAIQVVGYQKLCYLLADDPELVEDIFTQIGTRLVRYYEIVAAHPGVGACIDNDDWGFKTQTMLSPRQMRQYVFPWHRRIVAAVHAVGKPVILHSCGHFDRILDDILEMDIDGRHSYEDNILPVEKAYELHRDKFAILGGIDLDFICRASPEAVYQRAKTLLEQIGNRGGYALGTGNSVPDYVPDENYFAMTSAALDLRG
ncbi:uroporphyrinogen decarboxylase family protein [Chloroflexota bacterium]